MRSHLPVRDAAAAVQDSGSPAARNDATTSWASRLRSLPPLPMLVVLAIALRTGTWWAPHTLFGVMEYDDGVYYSAAKLLLHGLMPYSDFTIVHPPLLSIVLLPAAAFGQVFGDPAGMAGARICMQAVAAANIVLIYRLGLRLPAAPERARRAALLAAGLYAVMPNAVISEHTVLLEPLVSLACLTGVFVLLHRDVAGRGAAFACGFLMIAGLGIKLFAGAYVVAVVVWVLATRQFRLLLPYAGGLAAGLAVLIAPLVAAAPSAAWHDVVVTQLARPENTGVDQGLERVSSMVGLGYLPAALGALLLFVVIVKTALLIRMRPASSLVLWSTVLGLSGIAILTAPTYFLHYGAFLAPPLVLLASRLVAFDGGGRRTAIARAAFAGAIAASFAVGTGSNLLHQQGQADLRRVTAAVVPRGSCVYYDAVSLALAADVYQEPSDRCPSWVDGRGVALTRNTSWPRGVDFYPEGFVADSGWQAANVAQMQKADYLLLRSSPASFPEWTDSTRRYVLNHFVPVWTGGRESRRQELWKRTTTG